MRQGRLFMEDLLQQGIAACKAGKRDQARKIFITVVKQSPDSERAWGWMNNVCNTDQERIHCLKQIVRINPKNEKAQQRLNQLLAPPFPSELPLSPISSVPLPPTSLGGIAKRRNSGFTQTQLFVLVGLSITLVLLLGITIFFLLGARANAVIAAAPTSFDVSSPSNTPLPTQVLPTVTLIPTYAYAATWTPLPSPTSFVITPPAPPTSIPQQAQANPAPANPSSANSASDCSSQLDYAAAIHQYNLDAIDYIHSPLISLYQSWIDEAARDRDALGMVDAQRKLDNEQAQVKAEKAAENKRYKAEQASLNASCQ
jgi:hypothetical protein